jgi:hypothetical protein
MNQAAVDAGGAGDRGDADLLPGTGQLVEGFEHPVSSAVGVCGTRSGQVVR